MIWEIMVFFSLFSRRKGGRVGGVTKEFGWEGCRKKAQKVEARRRRARCIDSHGTRRRDVIFKSHQSDIGLAEPAFADTAAGDEGRGVAEHADEPRAEAIEHTRKHENLGRFDERA